jgi:flagellar basal-body rod protein FlgB
MWEVGQAGARALEAALSALEVRQSLIARNLATADTPGYQALDVDFGALLARTLASSGAAVPPPGGWVPPVPPSPPAPPPATLAAEAGGAPGGGTAAVPVRAAPGPVRADGNTVDMDAEMVRLAETGLWDGAASRLLALDFGRLRTAVTEGRQ